MKKNSNWNIETINASHWVYHTFQKLDSLDSLDSLEVRFIDSWWWSSFVWHSNNSNFCHFLKKILLTVKSSFHSINRMSACESFIFWWNLAVIEDEIFNIHHVAFQYFIWDISRFDKLSSSKSILNSDLDTRP